MTLRSIEPRTTIDQLGALRKQARRQFDTRAGSLDLAISKLRQGSYFPDWLLERRKRAGRALTTVVATCYLLGVATRRMYKLVETLASPACRSRRCR